MVGSTGETQLGPVVAAARNDPVFLAGRAGAAGAAGEEALVARLQLAPSRLERLLLCKAPRPSRFASDVRTIAEFVGIEPTRLAAALRELDVVGALRAADTRLRLGDTALLAARDADDDQVSPSSAGSERLRELAQRFWNAAPQRVRRDRDVEAASAWSVRLTVVIASPLSVANVRTWLHEREIAVSTDDDVALYGFLMAWRGLGIVFCDGTLDTDERRFTLAHEIGHFLLDYDRPRRRVIRDAPELLEVIDGVRPATAADRTQALLPRVPLGVHTHFLGESGESAEREDEASRFALELLSPWEELLAVVRDVTTGDEPYRHLHTRMTELVAHHFRLPEFAARSRSLQALDALGIQPGFFER